MAADETVVTEQPTTDRRHRALVRITALVRRGRGASGAIMAQLVQALISFVLHVTAARQLGASGLGIFALIYSAIVLATAFSSGMVGDSLTVLERHQERIRAGLQVMTVGIVAVASLVVTAVAVGSGGLGWVASMVVGAVVIAFTVEDLARRLLMASLRFWSVVVTDATALLLTVLWLIGTHALTGGIGLTDLLLALLVGQCGALCVAVLLLPPAERTLAGWRAPDVSTVVRFGAWRAAQQGVRPATLTAMRSVAILAVGAATFGELEGARVYVAPTLLAVNGISGFLFSSYASQRQQSRRSLLRRADVGALSLALLIVAAGVIALVLMPVAGPLVTGGEFDLDGVAVFGWVVYAGCTAFLTPYGGLAAVSGAQARVFAIRVGEGVVSLLGLTTALLLLDVQVRWVPYVLGPGALIAGLLIRHICIIRGADLDAPLGSPGAAADSGDGT